MIHFNCLFCYKPLRVADDLAGKKIKCRHCHEDQGVPALNPDEKEPLFYRYIEVLTKFFIYLFLIAFTSALAVGLYSIGFNESRGLLWAIYVAAISLGWIFMLCFSLLLIDIGRSLRVIRHNTVPKQADVFGK